MTPDTSTARVERVLDGELCEDHGQIVASDCFACELVKAQRAVKHLLRERDRLESALQTERGKLEAADAANDALARDAARYRWLRGATDLDDVFRCDTGYAVHWLDDGEAAIDAAIKGRE